MYLTKLVRSGMIVLKRMNVPLYSSKYSKKTYTIHQHLLCLCIKEIQKQSYRDCRDFLDEFERGTGMVFLNHSLGSHQDWPGYAKLVGGKFYIEDYTVDTSLILDYYHDINLKVRVIDPDHPVTRGVGDYEVIDEGYVNTELLPGLKTLLETDHSKCDRYVGWTHEVGNSRVVYLMGGHDKRAFENESFSRILENAIRWTSENVNP